MEIKLKRSMRKKNRANKIKMIPVGASTIAKAIILRGVAEKEIKILLNIGAEIDMISLDLVQRLGLKPATDYIAPGLEGFQGEIQQAKNAYWMTFFLLNGKGQP
jgi:hypothetical protein